MTMITNLGNIEITERQITSAIMMASMHARQLGSRADGMDAVDVLRAQWDAAAASELQALLPGWQPDPEMRADWVRAVADGRVDALTPGPAGFVRDFDYIHREILMEERPQLNAGLLFPPDSTVPLGAPTHSVRRSVVTGRAKWHNKGDSFPNVKAGYIEENFRTGFVVAAIEASLFEGLQIGFAGLQTYRIEADGAIRAIEEFLNDVAFYGDVSRQIYGALTYPHLAKMVLPTRFGGASTGREIAAALHALVNRPMIASGGVFRPNRLVTSEEVHAFLATTPLDASGGDTTIKEFFLKGQNETTGIRDIEIARELSATEMTAKSVGNPAGYHGIFAYRGGDRLSVAHVLPQRPTFLPIWNSSPIDTIHVAMASTGGITMHNVGNNILGFVQL